MVTRNTKSKLPKKGSYQVSIASIFFDGMLNFQVGASKVFEAFFSLKGNSNFSKQSGFGIRSHFINSAKGNFGKSKGKVIPLASDDDFEKAKPFEKPHYINTFNIHKF
tara:strand:+ start:451 stop:774 length:324 start_codon:yes stop_codon:yes gene_type:complete